MLLVYARCFIYTLYHPKTQLGSGWASHAFVKLASTYDLRIVVVSPVNHFVFTPMLASAAVGTVEYRYVCYDIYMIYAGGGLLTLEE